MNSNHLAATGRTIVVTVLLCVATVVAGGAVQARQDQGPLLPTLRVLQRPLERVGTQYVRGDDLTGNGVPAPLWIHQR